jgi:hypothetical protein
MTDEQCPICEEGTLSDTSWDNIIEHRGHSQAVICKASVCSYCEVLQASGDQLSVNAGAVKSFRAEVDAKLDAAGQSHAQA